MSWGLRRQLLIVFLIALVVAGIVGGTYYFAVHKAPSCVDSTQNQGEEGIDCGGPCTYLCSEGLSAPSVRFVRPLTPVPGRTDIIAYVDNPNSHAAAQGLHYTIELYSPTNTVVAKKEGSIDLPPSSTVPVFVPNIFSGSQDVARAFITFDTPAHLWYSFTATQVVPVVATVQYEAGDTPRITTTATNPSTTTLTNVTFVVTLFDASGNAVASSKTVTPSIPGLGSVPLVFTWSAPFTGTVSKIEVVPVVPLPPLLAKQP